VPADLHFALDLADEAATAAFAEDVAAALAPGDVIGLSGGLGAGKTTFARALLRALAGDDALEVPSPTFTLVQTYALQRLAVAHFDLYRLSSADELDELGLTEALAEGAALIEWPERGGDRLPTERTAIAFDTAGYGRKATVTARGGLAERLTRSRAARAFLDQAGWKAATRRHLQGDASARVYERVGRGGRNAVLMDWPPRGALAAGDPRAAFRAREPKAFVAVAGGLKQAGLSVPEIHAADLSAGYLLLEDFGEERIAANDVPLPERYRAAVDALATLHAKPRPVTLPLPGGNEHRLPHLTGDVLMAEVTIFADSYVPQASERHLAASDREELLAIWRGLDERLQQAERSWVVFDVQSPNLFWLPERSDIERVGWIDFQDMFVGASAYDVASLCQDARVTVPPALEDELKAHYVAARRAADPAFDADSFAAAYAITSALRQSKNMGAFSRLEAAGKGNYARHLPRARAYLGRALIHPVLSALSLWYERHLSP
jgi:tRNA threonylcarbamoyl adenosine modification protein YjeE